jgi:NAD(P)-dependent dehydrogenase (short-subunit alcohol dehydrogenase family)
MTFRDRAVVVTGGGGGIGRHLVFGLLERGARVAALDVRQEGLDETADLAAAGDRLSTHTVDVSNRDGVQGAPEQVLARHGSIDGVIHNAGIIQPFVRFVDLDYEAIDKVVAVNLYGTIHMAKAFLPHLVTRPEAPTRCRPRPQHTGSHDTRAILTIPRAIPWGTSGVSDGPWRPFLSTTVQTG